MNKKRSSRYHLLRYVVLGAVMGIAVLSLNFTKAIAKTEKSVKHIAGITFSKDTVKPAAVPAPPAPVPPPPPPAPPAPVKGKGTPAVPAVPAAPAVPGTAVPAVPAVPAAPTVFTAVTAPGVPDPEVIELAAESIMLKKPSPEHKPLVFLDGVNMGHNMPEGLAGEDIQSISVFKGEHAAVYGEDGKDGVIFIYTKGYNDGPTIKTGAVNLAPRKHVTISTTPATNNNGLTTVNSGNGPVKTVKVTTNTNTNTKTTGNENTNTAATVNSNANTDTANRKSENK